MTRDKRINLLLPSILFECYFIAEGIWLFIKSGTPEYSLWVLAYVIKFGLGYLVYRLYISQSRKLSLLGPFALVLLIIGAYITYYLELNTIYRILGGFDLILLGANTFFLFRYFKHPDIISANLERANYSLKQIKNSNNMIQNSTSLLTGVAIFTIIINMYDGIIQLLITGIWIIFCSFTEGIIKAKNRMNPEIDTTLHK